MNNLEMYIFVCIMYFVSFILIVVDVIHTEYALQLSRKIWFYLLTNATLILRIFGSFPIIIFLHIFLHSLVLYLIYYTYVGTFEVQDWSDVSFFWMPLFCQILLACMLMFLRLKDDDPLYLGMHGTIGIWVVSTFYWNLQAYKQSYWCGLASMGYMLMFLGIVLMPHGLVEDLANYKREGDEENVRFGTVPCGPGPI